MEKRPEIPENWCLIEYHGSDKKYLKVVATWKPKRINGQAWKVSSCVTGYKQNDEVISIENVSGRTYICDFGLIEGNVEDKIMDYVLSKIKMQSYENYLKVYKDRESVLDILEQYKLKE